jgi:OCT family organic cation transporter-like MFS transporter 1
LNNILPNVNRNNLRTQAVGAFSTIARVGCLMAPFLAPLAKIWQPLPMVVLGLPALISAFLNLKLPETKGLNLPQTMEDAEHIEDLEMKEIEPNIHKENVRSSTSM